MQSLEGWQAWDLLIKLSPTIERKFPVTDALKLGETLGYDAQAMAEFLPEIALGVALGFKDLEQN